MFAETIRARPDIATGEGIDSSIPFVRVLLQFERIRSSLLEEMQAVEASGEVGMLNLVHGIILRRAIPPGTTFSYLRDGTETLSSIRHGQQRG
jgi:hypothetical protein